MYLPVELLQYSLALAVNEADLVSMFLHAKNHLLLATDGPKATV